MVNFFKCDECGNIMMEMGTPNQLCGNSQMKLMEPAQGGKNAPTVSVENGMVVVHIDGHPMDEGNYIQWVYLKTSFGGLFCKLEPGDPPQAMFKMNPDEVEEVYAYSAADGLSKAKEPVLPLSFDLNAVACSPEFTAGCVNPSQG